MNGVGVTYQLAHRPARRARVVQGAIAVDHFGEAFDKMACAHALQDRRELALRCLPLAAPDGFAAGIDSDPDVARLRGGRVPVKATP